MARVPFLNAEDLPEHTDLVDRIQGQRRGSLINVYRTLMHSPPLAESWFEHINRVRWGTEISGRLREVVIIRLGHLVSSAYVLRQHVPALAAAEGMTLEECAALADWRVAREPEQEVVRDAFEFETDCRAASLHGVGVSGGVRAWGESE